MGLSWLELHWLGTIAWTIVGVVVVFVLPSIRIIGPTEVGLVTKRFSLRRLPDDNPIAFHGEVGIGREDACWGNREAGVTRRAEDRAPFTASARRLRRASSLRQQ